MNKTSQRQKRHFRVRRKVKGDRERPRLSVFRSHHHIYAQIIDDSQGKTLVAESDLRLNKKVLPQEIAYEVGKSLAKKAVKKGIKEVVFDRGGFLYHGRIKRVAEGAREGGLKL